jgi:hypothetical protein
MSYQFSATELETMRTAQDGHMLDTGNVQPYATAQDSFGQVVETWPTNSASIACGLDMRAGSERHGADKTVVSYDATVRLPIGTTVDLRDKFRVIKRFDETLTTPLVFAIVSPIQRGPSGIRLMLKRVET